MFRSVSYRGCARVLLASAGALSLTTAVSAQSLLDEDFSSNPIGTAGTEVGDTGRFTYDSVNDRVIAEYDTSKDTAMLQFGLGQSLDQDDSFRFEVDFEIFSSGLSADNFGQIAFGLVNQTTTGGDRAGGAPAVDDAFDLLTVDYFPWISPIFGGPSLGPTIIETDNTSGFFGQINGTFDDEGSLDPEGALPEDAVLTATLTYLAGQSITLELNASGLPVNINSVGTVVEDGPTDEIKTVTAGGLDGINNTIQLDLTLDRYDGLTFTVDTFALTLFNDSNPFPVDSNGVFADVAFQRVSVEVVPEPGSMTLLLGSAALLFRRRRTH